jgi:DMSO/TMAO reductase YedYZ molybdopterin-dependent catalytic subunit
LTAGRVEYEGVQVSHLLKLVGVKLGDDLRRPVLARYALVEAADGYREVFSLTELDEEVTERVVLLADRRDGQALDAKEGPLRFVIPDEKRHVRWVRQVTAINVREAPRVTDDVEK